MALTDNERAAIRLHLGYSNTRDGTAIGFGIAHISPFHRSLDLCMAELKADSEPDVRDMIRRLDDLECRREKLLDTVGTRRVESIEFSGQDGLDVLDGEKRRLGKLLADLLGTVVNPYAAEWQGAGHGGGGVREGCW